MGNQSTSPSETAAELNYLFGVACSARRRARRVNDWALRNGFLGGPNMYHADHPNGRVGGSIVIKPNQADVRWIDLYTDP